MRTLSGDRIVDQPRRSLNLLGSSGTEGTGRQDALGTGHYGLEGLSLLPSLDLLPHPKSCFTRRMSPLSLPAQLSSPISIGLTGGERQPQLLCLLGLGPTGRYHCQSLAISGPHPCRAWGHLDRLLPLFGPVCCGGHMCHRAPTNQHRHMHRDAGHG